MKTTTRKVTTKSMPKQCRINTNNLEDRAKKKKKKKKGKQWQAHFSHLASERAFSSGYIVAMLITLGHVSSDVNALTLVIADDALEFSYPEKRVENSSLKTKVCEKYGTMQANFLIALMSMLRKCSLIDANS